MRKEQGIAHILLLILLLIGIVAGVYLIQNKTNLFSKASNPPIVFRNTSGAALPVNSSNIPQSASPTVKIEFTSTLGPPKPTSSVSGPVKNYTVSFRYAEDPISLDNSATIPYITTAEPYPVTYTFKNQNPGTKFIWAEFKDNLGKTDRRSAQIELISATPSGTPTPQAFQCTPCNSDVNKSGSVDAGDVSYLIGCYNKKAADKDRSGKSCADRDINGNGVVDGYDFSCIRTVFNQQCQSSPTPTPTPTPTPISCDLQKYACPDNTSVTITVLQNHGFVCGSPINSWTAPAFKLTTDASNAGFLMSTSGFPSGIGIRQISGGLAKNAPVTVQVYVAKDGINFGIYHGVVHFRERDSEGAYTDAPYTVNLTVIYQQSDTSDVKATPASIIVNRSVTDKTSPYPSFTFNYPGNHVVQISNISSSSNPNGVYAYALFTPLYRNNVVVTDSATVQTGFTVAPGVVAPSTYTGYISFSNDGNGCGFEILRVPYSFTYF